MNSASAFLMWMIAEVITAIAPAYPPNAIMGGNAVAVIHVSAGSVGKVDILQGEAPFVESTRSALSGWRFNDSDSGAVLAVVNFRTPNLYPTGSPARNLDPIKVAADLACPRMVVEPSYPPNSLGEGAVVLRLSISGTGSISKVRIVHGLGDLTGPCLTAVRKWQFDPARNDKGIGRASEVYAVFVMRRPILPRRLNP